MRSVKNLVLECLAGGAVSLLWVNAAHASDTYECISEEVVDALECGTSTVEDAALCGSRIVTDAAKCGTKWVTSAAQCGTQWVTSSAQCGTKWVTSAAQCGTQRVTDAAKCGTRVITSAATCGTETIKDGAICGWNHLSSLFGLIKKPKSCTIAKSCRVANTCDVARSCSVAASCNVAKSCSVPQTCAIANTCAVANRCDVERCTQPEPYGECIPGVAECDIEGFACQLAIDESVFRCQPAYEKNLNVADRTVCLGLYDPKLAQAAVEAGVTMSYSVGSGANAVAATALEVGTVYGENGEYGCFSSNYVGAVTDVSIAAYTAIGMFNSWDVFGGVGRVVSGGASIPGIEAGFTTSEILSEDHSQLVGTSSALSIGVGLLPVQAGYLTCNTTVYQVF